MAKTIKEPNFYSFGNSNVINEYWEVKTYCEDIYGGQIPAAVFMDKYIRPSKLIPYFHHIMPYFSIDRVAVFLLGKIKPIYSIDNCSIEYGFRDPRENTKEEVHLSKLALKEAFFLMGHPNPDWVDALVHDKFKPRAGRN